MINHHCARTATHAFTTAGLAALFVGGVVGCGPDGSDVAGDLAASFDDDVSGVVLEPGDPWLVTATEFEFTPTEIIADPGDHTGLFVNEGAVAHNLTFSSGESFDLGPGDTMEIAFAVPEGGLSFVCSIEGHEAAGMTGEVHTRTTPDDDVSDDQ